MRKKKRKEIKNWRKKEEKGKQIRKMKQWRKEDE